MWKHKTKWLVRGGRKVRCYLCGKKILAKGDLFLFHQDTGYYSHQSCMTESTTISGNERRRAVKKIAVGAAVAGAIAAGAGKLIDISSQSKGSNSPAAQTILTSQGLILPALTSDPANPVAGQMWYRSDAGVTAHFDSIQNRVVYSSEINDGNVHVTSKGIINGLSVLPNDGTGWFGPDTTSGATAPGQYGSPYTKTSGIQEGVNFIPNGGIVKLGDGNFITSKTITVASHAVTIEGTGYGDTGYATEITVNGNIDGFDFTTGFGGAIKNIFVQGSGSTSSAAINHTSTAGQGFRVENIRIEGFYNGIFLTAATDSFVNNILFGTITGSAITVNGGFDMIISNCLGGGTTSTYALNGINMLDSGAFWIQSCDFSYCSTGLNIAPPSGSQVVNGFVYGVSCDTGDIGMYINGENGNIQSITFVNCWTSSNSNSGGIIQNGTPTGLTFIGLRAIINGKEGWFVEGGTEIEFDDCFFIANNTSDSPISTGVGSGLEFAGASTSVYRVKGGKSTNSSTFGFSGGYQQIGITIDTATMEQYSIIDVDVTGNLTTGISDDGTATVSKILKDNLGFNPTGFVGVATPTIGASGATYANKYGYPVRIYFTSAPSGTTYNITGTHGNNIGSAITVTAGQQITLDNGDSISVTYTTAPTWKWYGAN